MRKTTISTLVLLLATLMLSGCFVPVPVLIDDGNGGGGGHHDNGRRGGGGRH